MNLWIRSQNKEDLVKADNIRIKHEYHKKEAKEGHKKAIEYAKENLIEKVDD